MLSSNLGRIRCPICNISDGNTSASAPPAIAQDIWSIWNTYWNTPIGCIETKVVSGALILGMALLYAWNYGLEQHGDADDRAHPSNARLQGSSHPLGFPKSLC